MKVSAIKCPTYDDDQVLSALSNAIEQIQFSLPEDKRVLIKPNIMSQNKPEQHTVTHPAVIDGLCRLLVQRGNTVYIGDSLSFYEKGLTSKAFTTTGLRPVAQKYGAKLIPFEKTPLVRLTKEDHALHGLDDIILPKLLLDVDMIINACKLKTHSAMRFSGAIKNMFGCLPGGYKQKLHMWVSSEAELADVFITVHKLISPALNIMDAITSLDGGPSALGKPVNTGYIFASENPLALDVVAASMIGYDPDTVPMLRQAKDRQMLQSFNDIELIGSVSPCHFRSLVGMKKEHHYNSSSILAKHTYVNLKINQEICTGCRKCMEVCPVDAIHTRDGIFIIDQGKCINCYRCPYVCSAKAVVTVPTFMNRLGWGIRKVTGL